MNSSYSSNDYASTSSFPPKKGQKCPMAEYFLIQFFLCVFFLHFKPQNMHIRLIKVPNFTENKHSSLYNQLLLWLKKSTNVSTSEISDDNIWAV